MFAYRRFSVLTLRIIHTYIHLFYSELTDSWVKLARHDVSSLLGDPPLQSLELSVAFAGIISHASPLAEPHVVGSLAERMRTFAAGHFELLLVLFNASHVEAFILWWMISTCWEQKVIFHFPADTIQRPIGSIFPAGIENGFHLARVFSAMFEWHISRLTGQACQIVMPRQLPKTASPFSPQILGK